MQGTFYNIIGVLKGDKFGQAGDRIIGLAAHYDTVDISPGTCSSIVCMCLGISVGVSYVYVCLCLLSVPLSIFDLIVDLFSEINS